MNDVSERLPDWVGEMLTAVDRAFEVTGADTPGWPDPHSGGREPRDEEYSRVSDVSKYRILDTRVDAWVEVLAESGLAETRAVPAESWIAACRPATDHVRVRRIAPARAGGLALLFATTRVDGAPFGLDVGIVGDGTDPVLVEWVPSCGCDACDHGSAELLDHLDGWVLTVAQGGVVHARRGDGFVTRTLHGWMAQAGHEAWLDESARVPTGVRRWVGNSWL